MGRLPRDGRAGSPVVGITVRFEHYETNHIDAAGTPHMWAGLVGVEPLSPGPYQQLLDPGPLRVAATLAARHLSPAWNRAADRWGALAFLLLVVVPVVAR